MREFLLTLPTQMLGILLFLGIMTILILIYGNILGIIDLIEKIKKKRLDGETIKFRVNKLIKWRKK